MHTASFDNNSFQVEVDGHNSDLSDLFPGWGELDRFGIVVDESYGGLGASLLIQAAIASFYVCAPTRRTTAPEYPEIYMFHFGGRHGDHSNLDFFPPRKEVFVAKRNASSLLAAINDRSITRLAVPSTPPGNLEYLALVTTTWAEQSSARQRLRSCFAYSPSGNIEGGNVSISANDPSLEQDVAWTLDPLGTLDFFLAVGDNESPLPGPSTRVDLDRYVESVRTRISEVGDEVRKQILSQRAISKVNEVQTFRTLGTGEALEHLAGLHG